MSAIKLCTYILGCLTVGQLTGSVILQEVEAFEPMCPSSIFESHDFAEITVSRYPRNELYGPVDGQGYCPMVGGIDQSPRRFVMGRHYSVCMPKIPIEMPCPLPPQTLAKAVHDGSEPQCVIPCDVDFKCQNGAICATNGTQRLCAFIGY